MRVMSGVGAGPNHCKSGALSVYPVLFEMAGVDREVISGKEVPEHGEDTEQEEAADELTHESLLSKGTLYGRVVWGRRLFLRAIPS